MADEKKPAAPAPLTQPPKARQTDKELVAMGRLVRLMATLSEAERIRVAVWFGGRYGPAELGK